MADPFDEWDQQDEHRKAPKEPTRRRRRWRRLLNTVAALVVLGLVSLSGLVVVGYATTKQPNPNKDFQTATTFVYYNDGHSELGTFEIQNRQPLTYDEIPQDVKQAVVAAENRSFWTDRGISIKGMARAAYLIARGKPLQGGSTITQQYIKILYLNQQQTVRRKFKELFLAAKINRQLSKADILTGYLNPAEDPANVTPLLARYRYVLQFMSETGAITAEQAATYSGQLPPFPKVKVSSRYGGTKGFLLKMVQRELIAAGFDSSQINGGGTKPTAGDSTP